MHSRTAEKKQEAEIKLSLQIVHQQKPAERKASSQTHGKQENEQPRLQKTTCCTMWELPTEKALLSPQ